MAGYMEYKDSGIPWLGEYPAHWECCRVKNSFFSTKTIVGEVADSYERLALTLNGVVKRSKIDAGGLQPERFETYQVLRENELVFKLIDLQNVSTSRIGRSPYTGIVSPAYIILHERNNRSTRYAEYYFLSMWMHQVFNQLGADGVRSNIGAAALLDIPFLLPPESEQESIVTFLDVKINRIDTIIAEAKASIEEYKAWKASIIHEAVTKGLDPNVEMKESGVKWIGNIPMDWAILSAKSVVYINHGSDPQTEGNIPVYGSGANSFRTCGEFKEGPAVLVGRKGATLHIPHYIEGKYWNVDTAFDVKPFNESILLKYYYYLATCFDYKYYMSQTTLPSMTQTSYNSMKIPVPNPTEQKAIVEFLNEKSAAIDLLIDEKAAQPIIVLLFLVVHGVSKGVLKTNAVSYGIHGGSKPPPYSAVWRFHSSLQTRHPRKP